MWLGAVGAIYILSIYIYSIAEATQDTGLSAEAAAAANHTVNLYEHSQSAGAEWLLTVQLTLLRCRILSF